MRRFELTDEQEQRVKGWHDVIRDELVARWGDDDDSPAPWPHIEYVFVETGIGLYVEVRETITQQKLNITEYDKW